MSINSLIKINHTALLIDRLKEDFLRFEYKSDGTLADCDIPCIWKQGDPGSLSPTELQTVDALFNVNSQPMPKTHEPDFHMNYELFDIYSSFDEDSDLPTSYVRASPNSTLISFIATRMTEYRRTFIPSLQAQCLCRTCYMGAPNVRSYLPHPKSAILIEDFPDVEALANYLKYLAKNETAYLKYHKWKTMEFSNEFEKKSYMSLRTMECNICK
ncbi:25567_t:CDS:2 [Dentiscutata erythropus]|uniref:Fucosyltransferase n=1 Tax=Dentiscutata erythropus TaxID=1348616 RepID=A0A9N8VNV2_9GLOM|nr:25567_t:CDS:2 [Dentiscutata erythropus]